MKVLIPVLIIVALAMLGLGLGLLFGRPCLRRGCSAETDESGRPKPCQTCGRDPGRKPALRG